ncbi:hypothetical protein FOZ63_017317 [Perkinsus olseni]|uniref:Uncharacterized protein n=1 Tax=Perkinsus olseni TaxID=32597 RepID=A0A7J6QMP9_PEROL|nr:hypothetical protein FOZ63_017317 [Perkinsus olseni]
MRRFHKTVRSYYNAVRLFSCSGSCRRSWVVLVVVVSLGILFVVYGILDPWPYSPLDPHSRVKRLEHDKFMKEAEVYFEPSPSLVVLTTPRQGPYIRTFLWSYLALNDDGAAPRPLPVLHILNRGDPDIPVQARHSPSVEVIDLDPLPTLDYNSWRRNLYVDHIGGLDECLKLNSTWCIIFENDAMLTDHFLTKFHKYIGKAVSDTAMVKLFVSDHWSGYEDVDVPYFVLFFIISSALLTIVFARRKVPSRVKALLYASAVSGMLILLALLITKQQLLKLRYVGLHSPVSLMETNVRASTVATAYPQGRVQSIKDYLQRELDSGPEGGDGYDLDFSQFNWAKQEGKILRTYPSLVQHMGVRSSSKGGDAGDQQQLYSNLAQDSSFVIHYDSLIDDDGGYPGESLPIHV